MTRFAAATLTPFLLVACAAGFGGLWVWMALIYLTGFIFLLDMLGANAAPDVPEDQEFPASTWLLITLGLLHFILIGLLIWTSLPAAGLETGARIGIAVATGLIWGQISHPVAHELIHARQPF
ncbi:MAG: alkane 1-monooxygenase, partial [Pseudomonadota bacterium]